MLPPPPPPRSTAIITNALPSSSSSSSSSPALCLPPFPPPPPHPPHPLFFIVAAALSFLFLRKPHSSPPPPPFLSFLLHPPRLRRCLPPKPLSMDRTAASEPPLLNFSSPESLAEWLNPRLPSGSLASWGIVPGTKTLHNLWIELSQGETSLLLTHPLPQELQESEDPYSTSPLPPPLRAVHVATVRVRNHVGSLLLESHQLLSDGTVRHRLRPLSEKMRPGESIEDAAIRAIREELGGEVVARIVPGSYIMRVEERASVSYPGLPARYVLHSVDAEVEGLPEEGEFSTEEAGEDLEAREGKAVFVRRHFWKWVKDDGSIPHFWA